MGDIIWGIIALVLLFFVMSGTITVALLIWWRSARELGMTLEEYLEETQRAFLENSHRLPPF